MKYLEYEIKLALANEVNDTLFFLMQNYMQTHAKSDLDIFLKQYYLNDDYLNKCLSQKIPLYVCFEGEKLIGALAFKADNGEALTMHFNSDKEDLLKEFLIFVTKDFLERYPNVSALTIANDSAYRKYLQTFGFIEKDDYLSLTLKHPLSVNLERCNDIWKYPVIKMCEESIKSLSVEEKSLLTDDYLNNYLSSKMENIIVAIYENKLIGFSMYENASVLSDEKIAKILCIHIIDEYRGYGVGKLLLKKTLEEISYKKVVVSLSKHNTIGTEFFLRHAFSATGKEVTFKLFDLIPLKGLEFSYLKQSCKLTKLEAIKERRSVRNFTSEALADETLNDLENYIAILNKESGLSFRIIKNNPEPFACGLDHYGKFTNVNQYFALVGPKGFTLEEKCGYYGERLVIHATEIGLGTCWVTLTYDKKLCKIDIKNEEKLVAVIPFGYYTENLKPHNSKPLTELYRIKGAEKFDWFFDGVMAASLAPTAFNQQKFLFTLTETGKVKLESKPGIFTSIDLGIAKYNFEVGTNGARFSYKK